MTESFELSHFDGFYHLFAAANIAYALSPEFRRIINEGLGKANLLRKETVLEMTGKLKQTLKECKKVASYEKAHANMTTKVGKLETDYITKIIQFEGEYKTEKGYVELKKLYLVSGLYSLIILIFGGMQQFFKDDISFLNFLFWTTHTTMFIGIIFELVSLYYSKLDIGLTRIFAVFLLLVGISLFYSVSCPLANSISGSFFGVETVICGVVFVISPYILQFFAEIRRDGSFKNRAKALRDEFVKEHNTTQIEVLFVQQLSENA